MTFDHHSRSRLAALILLGAAGASAAAAIDTELVPVTASSYPFFAATIDLAEHGFIEEEYFVSGTGNVYEYDALGEVRIQTPGVPYKTRILVRRPSPRRFNGVVLFEMMNPTAGHDIDFEWHYNRELLLDDGYAWVGITMKDTAVALLQGWEPVPLRYLELPGPGVGLRQLRPGRLPATRLREPGETPLEGYRVRRVIATGYSQSADYMVTFSNEFHEQSLEPDGSHTFDGYLLGGGTGAARRINSADPGALLRRPPPQLRRRPLMRVQSETEVAFFASVFSRQPGLGRLPQL